MMLALSILLPATSALVAKSPSMAPGRARTTPVVRMSELSGARRFSVYLENDSYNMREYVSRVLMMVAEISESKATAIMLEAGSNWMALVGTWNEDIAQHVYMGMRKKGLSATIVPVVESGENDIDNEGDPRPRYLDGSLIEEEGDLPGWYQ